MACSLQQPPSGPSLLTIYSTVVPFTNYSQWERTPHKSPEVVRASVSGRVRAKPKVLQDLVASGIKKTTYRHSGFTPNARESTIVIRSRTQDVGKRVGTGYGSRGQLESAAARLRLLKMRIATKKVSVEDIQHHKEELFSANLCLMQRIQNSESSIHTDVDKMLERYTNFKGAISKLQTKAGEEIEKAKEELEMTRSTLEESISELRRTVNNTERIVRKKSRELNVLLNYKETEFPVKLVKIDQLKEQCELLNEDNEADLVEVELMIAEEWEKCGQIMDSVRRDLETKATQASLVTMKRSTQEKAIQNKIMEKELLIHEEKRYELEGVITTLKSNIRWLSEELEKIYQLRHKPSIAVLGKCLPNTELQFDFPRRQKCPL